MEVVVEEVQSTESVVKGVESKNCEVEIMWWKEYRVERVFV